MEHVWNPFLTFCAILVIAGVVYELLNIWRLYAQRPPRCKCKCNNHERTS